MDDVASSNALLRGDDVVNDVESTSAPCGGCHVEYRYTMRWMTWRAPVHYAVDDMASTGILCGG